MASRRATKRLLLVVVVVGAFCYLWILAIISRQFETAIASEPNGISSISIESSHDETSHETILRPSPQTTQTTNPLLFWETNIAKAEELLQQKGPESVRRTLTAYLEPKLNDTIPGTGRTGNPDDESDKGVPPDFFIPLPLRTTTPGDLKVYEYPRLQTCHDLPAHFPVDRGLTKEFNPTKGKPIIRNLLDEPTPTNYPWDEAPFCPVEADPFLPWIHDVFPSVDGARIEFVAQNRRRCKTGPHNFAPDLERLVPQSALLQPVSVQRLNETEAQRLAPSLWSPGAHSNNSNKKSPLSSTTTRYRLAPLEEASADSMWTRFICRFHTMDFQAGKTLILDETLSRFPFNYDYVAYRKNRPFVLTPRGSDGNMFWTSTLLFHCPVPSNLQELIANQSTILSDGTPTLHVDIIPIRTSVRYGGAEHYFDETLAGPRQEWATTAKDKFHKAYAGPLGFDPQLRWGAHNVLPRIEASGRWENIPICSAPSILPPPPAVEPSTVKTTKELLEGTSTPTTQESISKPHFLSACLWASATFHERGVQGRGSTVDTETKERLREWVEFHLMVGVDHIYVYDNTGAYTNETNLADITDIFPGKVTRIDWPSQVCNNRLPGVTNPGERSSQYAAESSCRIRYGQFTEWMASFDTDEYLIPQGNFTSLKDVVKQAQANGTNILSFRSVRAKLRADAAVEKGPGVVKRANATFLEAYNCDPVPLPKPTWADRARKQVYRPDYVLSRFVHYSTVTRGLLETYAEYQNRTPPPDHPWNYKYIERTERATDELTEAVMMHSKTTDLGRTKNYYRSCHSSNKSNRGCSVGYPWPVHNASTLNRFSDENGMTYNCYANSKVETYWVPLLRRHLGLDEYSK